MRTRPGCLVRRESVKLATYRLAAVSAFAVSAVFFAAAIVPASPAGILV